MKPTNEDKSCGDVISSNCITWNGPDLPCIGLCKGDSVSAVIYKIAKELCALMEMFNIDNYDLSCLDLANCPPDDFQQLMQLLITRICELEGHEHEGTGEATTVDGCCPDEYIVNIADCFYYTNPQGDTETTMTLEQYVTAIGNAFCKLGTAGQVAIEIGQANAKRIDDLETNEKNRVDTSIPAVVPICVIEGKDPVPMEELLTALERSFCELYGATGTPISLYEAVAKQCVGLSTESQLAGPGTMGQIEGWTDNENVADTLSNVWLTICDIRAAIKNIQATCCPSGCDGVDLELSAVLEPGDLLRIFLSGTLPDGFVECNPSGTPVTVMDSSGGKITVNVPLLTAVNNATGAVIDLSSTPVNPLEDLTITTVTCFRDTESDTQCQNDLSYFLSNTTACPTITVTPSLDSVAYTYLWTDGASTHTINLYDITGSTIIATQIVAVASALTVLNVFSGLASETGYLLELQIKVGDTTTTCPRIPVTTLSPPCLPPLNVLGNLTID